MNKQPHLSPSSIVAGILSLCASCALAQTAVTETTTTATPVTPPAVVEKDTTTTTINHEPTHREKERAKHELKRDYKAQRESIEHDRGSHTDTVVKEKEVVGD